MGNYYIFIDESGSFQRTKDRGRDFVGGFVSNNFSYPIIERKITEATQNANKNIADKNFHFDHNHHMHFVPLHIETDLRRQNENINFPKNNVPELVNEIFKNVRDNVLFVFKSKGFVRYFNDPESVYTNILRSTLFQAIEAIKEIDGSENINVDICIASKKAKERDYEPEEKFIRSLFDNLREELKVFDNIHFRLEIQKANNNIGLRLADFFCGALIKNFSSYYNYLANFEIKEFPVKHFSYNINSSLTLFENTYEYDNVLGIMLALELISSIKNETLQEQISLKIQDVINDYKTELFEEIDTTLYQFIILDRDKYTRLDFYKSFIETIKRYVHSNDDEIFNKKIELIIQKYTIKLMTQAGETELKLYYQYIENLKEKGYLIYKTRYLLLQELLDSILRVVPISFNSFNFQMFEEKINHEFENYKTIMPKESKIHDENLAKLEGTVGQMYAYLSDMYKNKEQSKSNDFFQTAEMLLKNDFEYCVEGDKAWKQAISYLISLYFKNKNLEECIKYYNLLTDNNSTNKIFNFAELVDDNDSDFYLLQRLYVCALASEIEDRKITNIDLIRNSESFKNNVNDYPYYLITKWLGVLYAQKGDLDTAYNLFEQACELNKSDEFIIKVSKLSIKVLKFITVLKLTDNKNNVKAQFSNEIKFELEQLSSEVEDIKEKLDMIGFNQSILDNYQNKSIFDVAFIMPFNYA